MNKPLLHRKVKFKAGDPPPAQPRLKVLGRLLGYVTRYALEVVAVIALLLLSTVLNLLIPYWLGVGLNNLSSTPDLRVITQLAIGIAIAAICSSGTMLWQTLMLNRVVQRALYRLRQDLFVATFLQYTRQFSIPIASLANNLDTLLAASAGAERIFSILDEPPAIVDQPNAPEMPPIQQ